MDRLCKLFSLHIYNVQSQLCQAMLVSLVNTLFHNSCFRFAPLFSNHLPHLLSAKNRTLQEPPAPTFIRLRVSTSTFQISQWIRCPCPSEIYIFTYSLYSISLAYSLDCLFLPSQELHSMDYLFTQ